LNGNEQLLQKKFVQFLRWEKVKKREKTLVLAFFYALIFSIIFLAARGYFPYWVDPRSPLPVIFFILAIGMFYWNRWGIKQYQKSILRLDRAFQLEERGITAWEILHRKEKGVAELLVLKEAAMKLGSVDVRNAFKRKLSWHAFFAPPLLVSWTVLIWLDIAAPQEARQPAERRSVAQAMKDFSQDLQKRSKFEQLEESFKVARSLETTADKGLRGEIREEKLRENIAEAMVLIGNVTKMIEKSHTLMMESRESDLEELHRLMKELEELKQSFHLPGKHPREKVRNQLERLASLPRFRSEIGDESHSFKDLIEKDAQKTIGILEKSIVTQLDQLTLSEIREFLGTLLQGENQDGEAPSQETTPEKLGLASMWEPSGKTGRLPGNQATKKEEQPPQPFLPARASVPSHLKGMLGIGERSSLRLQGTIENRDSTILEEEVLASYRKQAEEELATEKIPEEVRDTIKKYFLSLGMGNPD